MSGGRRRRELLAAAGAVALGAGAAAGCAAAGARRDPTREAQREPAGRDREELVYLGDRYRHVRQMFA